MLNNFLLIISPIFITLSIWFCNSKSILLNFTGEKHQKFTEKKNIPLIGGVYILLGLTIFLQQFPFSVMIYIFLVFIIGFFGDLKILKSPSIRFFAQSIVIFIFIIDNNIKIEDVRILRINELLEYDLFNYFFVFLALIVIINGSNFIDGLNTLLIGYYLIISYFLIKLDLISYSIIERENFIFLTLLLSILSIFNFFKKLFFGDSGAYLLGIFFGYILIDIYASKTTNFSPYFIVLLVWYPCFEILFSIIRKIIKNKSPLKPDTNHLHQLIFFYINKKISFLKNFKNSIVGILINCINFFIFMIASADINNTSNQLFLIIFLTLLYVLVYFKLKNYKQLSVKS